MSARWLPRPLALLCLAVLGGCTVGPDFAPPEPPQTTGYAREPLPARTVAADTPFGQAQTLHEGADIPAQWWDLFHCRQLNDLIEQALRASPDLAAARAALRQAAEQVKAQRGAYFPQVSAGLAASRNLDPVAALSASSASGNPYYSLYTGQLAVSFVPDVFGLNRRTVESLAAQQENAAFELIAADLTLTSNLVAAAIQEAGLRAQIETTRRIVAVEAQLLDVLHRQFAAGQAAETDVRAQEAALAQAQQTLPPLEKQLALQRDQLTALLGRLPAEEPAEQFALADLTLPANLPVSLPAELVAQRPDVRAAAATLHAASAQIGVAVANRLPQIQADGRRRPVGGTVLCFVRARHVVLHPRRRCHPAGVRRLHPAAPRAGGTGGIRSGGGAIPLHGHRCVPECRRYAAGIAQRRDRAAGRRGVGSCRAPELRHHPQAAGVGGGRHAEPAERGTDLSTGPAEPDPGANDPAGRYRRAVSGARRRLAETPAGYRGRVYLVGWGRNKPVSDGETAPLRKEAWRTVVLVSYAEPDGDAAE